MPQEHHHPSGGGVIEALRAPVSLVVGDGTKALDLFGKKGVLVGVAGQHDFSGHFSGRDDDTQRKNDGQTDGE